MKKALSLILAVILVFGMIPALAFFSDAAIPYTVTEYGNVVLTNLALGKTTTTGTGTSGANAVDGNTSTYVDIPYSTDNGATLNPNCWVTVDLGQEYHIDNIKIANYWTSSRYYYFDIYGSTDNATWTLLAQKTDNAHSKQYHSFNVDATVRYVKEVGIYDSANTGYHFADIQVYSNDEYSALEKGWDCGNFTASLSDAGVLTISGTGAVGTSSTSASDYPWFSRMNDIKELVVQDGITSIGQRAFTGYSNLAKVTLGKDVTTLAGQDVFSGGHSKEFVINGTLTSIGQGAVYNCTVDKVTLAEMSTPDFVRVCSISPYNYNFVRGIALNGTNDNYTWSVSENGKVLTISGTNAKVGGSSSTASSYPWYADYATTIEEIIVEPGIFVIGAHFADTYTKLKTVTIGPDVCYIYGDAFAHSKIETLNVQGVFTHQTTVISQGVFYDCGSIARVNLSEMTRYQFLTAIGKSSYNTDSVQSAKYGYNEVNTRTADISKYNDGELSGGEFVFIVNVPNYDEHGTGASDWKGKMSYGSFLVRESAGGNTNLRWVLNITAGGTTRDYTISPKSYYDFSGYGSSSTNGSQILARFAVATGNDCLPVANGDVVTINSITVTDLEKGQVVLQSKGSTVGTFTVPADITIPAKTYHTITWKLDDTVLYTATVSDGTVPTYPGQPLPEYKTEGGIDYALVTPATVAATEDATYTYTYVATSTVTATWLAPDGSVSATDSVLTGQAAHYTGPLANYTSGNIYYEYTIPGDGVAITEDVTYQITVTEHDITVATLGLWGSGYENWGTPETQLLLRIWDWEGNEIPQICGSNGANYYWVITINGTDYTATPSSYYGSMIIRFEPRYWATPFIPHQGTSYTVSAKVYTTNNELKYQSSNTVTITIANDFVPVHDHTVNCTSEITTPATCTEDGVRTYTCTDCGYVWTEAIAHTGHSLTAIPAVPATCTTAGNNAYWTCTACGKYFSDANGETEIAVDSWVISATGHDFDENGLCRNGCGTQMGAKIDNVFYPTLADAVANAQNDDVIVLLTDDYSLADGGELVIDKSLTIAGLTDAQGAPLCTIYGKSTVTGTNDIFITGSGEVALCDLKIKNFGNEAATDIGHAPIYVSSNFTGEVYFENLYISDFNRGGIFLYGGTFTVENCYIDCANSKSGAFTKGIEIKNTATGVIADTLICNMERSSTTYSSAGIEIYGTGDVNVDGCLILSDNDNHSSMKATYGIVIAPVGAYDPANGNLIVTDTMIDTTNGALSVGADNYSVVLEDCSFNNYIATWNDGCELVIESGDYVEDVYADAGTIIIHGGDFTNFLPDTGANGSIVIDGGTFDAPVDEAYCADGFIPEAITDPDTGDVVYGVKLGSYVAQIVGGDKFESLEEALNAADDNDTVILLDDETADRIIYEGGKTITLDLDGNAINARVSFFSGTITVTNGTINGRFDAYDDAVVTLAADATVNGPAVVWGDGTYGEAGCKTPTLNVYGTIINDGTTEDTYGITTNGTDKSGAIINIYTGAVITSQTDLGVYLPSGNLTVYGGTITGTTGIYVKSGSVTISGGTINGTGAAAEYSYNGNGGNATGDAFVIDSCGYPNGAPAAAISGGDFVSTGAKAVASYGYNDNAPIEGFVTGGTFSSEVPYALCAGNLETVPDAETGKYVVQEHTAHVWDDGEVTTAPTCVTTGVMTYTCTVCGETKTETIAALASASAKDYTDTITVADTDPKTSYHDWTYTTDNADYAGYSYGSANIQLKSKDNVSGVVMTVSSGTVKSVTVTFSSGATVGRVIDIYGSETAYTSAADLYSANTQGTLLGSLTYASGTYTYTLTLDDDYDFIGLRSNSGAANLDSIVVTITKLAPGDHTWNEGEITTEPGCLTVGEKTYTCTVCGETRTEEVEALGHAWNDGVETTAPTCVDAGETTFTCTRCGATKTEPIAATGIHTYGESTVTVQPSCTTVGERTFTCTVCGDTITEQIEALGHAWNDGEVTTAPTCVSTGVKTYTCTRCNETKTETIAALAESIVDTLTRADIDATGSSYGTWTYTSDNGVTYSGQIFLGNATQLQIRTTSPSGIVIDLSGLSAKNITLTFGSNTNANRAVKVYGSATAYDSSADLYNAETAGTLIGTIANGAESTTISIEGYDYIGLLAEGGALYLDEIEVEISGEHTWNDGEVTTEPGCLTAGEKTYTCTVCGATRTEEIAALGHNYAAIVTDPTCTEGGYTTHTCSRCGNSYTDDETEALGHNYGDPTIVWNGYAASATHTCGRCEAVEAVAVTVTDEITTPATCTATGTRTYTATVDGTEFSSTKDAVVAKLAHTFGNDGICTVCGAEAVGYSTTVKTSEEADVMAIRYKDLWEYVVYADDTAHAAPEGWLNGTDNETWTTARASIGAKSWGSWTTKVDCQYYTMFLRKNFTVTDASKVTGMTFFFLYDENPVVYINGQEVLSLTGYYDRGYVVFDLSQYTQYLTTGTNTLQISIMNEVGGGGFDAALCISYAADHTSISKGSVWEFAFTADNSEAAAPAGFIEGNAVADIPYGQAPFADPTYHNDPATYTVFSSSKMTVYFRQFFTVADPEAVTSITMDIKYDQDPVVYLNGVQVWTASGWHDSGFVTVDLSAYKNQLNEGENWLVVKEINPDGGGGAIFDLSLDVYAYYTAAGKVAPISASQNGFANFGSINAPANVLDGDQGTVCGSGFNAAADQYVRINFAKHEIISEIFVQCKDEGTTSNPDGHTRGTYDIYALQDGIETLIAQNVPAKTGTDGGYTVTLDTPVKADGIIVRITSWDGDCWACVADVIATPAVLVYGHVYSAWTVTAEPDCTTVGSRTRSCEDCSEPNPVEEIEALGHDWNEGEITTAPTCGAAGEKTFTCNRCHETTTEAIEATGEHTWTETSEGVTFTEGGIKTVTCSVCGSQHTEDLAKAELGLHETVVLGEKDGAKTATVIGTISETYLKLDSVDYLRFTISYEKDGQTRTVQKVVRTLYTSLTDIATTSEATAMATDLEYVDAAYIFAVRMNGVPAGEHVLNVTLDAIVDGAAVATAEATLEFEIA